MRERTGRGKDTSCARVSRETNSDASSPGPGRPRVFVVVVVALGRTLGISASVVGGGGGGGGPLGLARDRSRVLATMSKCVWEESAKAILTYICARVPVHGMQMRDH